jgi:hypothetical protein
MIKKTNFTSPALVGLGNNENNLIIFFLMTWEHLITLVWVFFNVETAKHYKTMHPHPPPSVNRKGTFFPEESTSFHLVNLTKNGCRNHRVDTQRVAMATFWRTFHHDGKFSQAWWGWGDARPPPFTLSTITSKVVVYPHLRGQIHSLFLLYPYMYSVVWTTPPPPPPTGSCSITVKCCNTVY